MASEYTSVSQTELDGEKHPSTRSDRSSGSKVASLRRHPLRVLVATIGLLTVLVPVLILLGYDRLHSDEDHSNHGKQNGSWKPCGDASGYPLECMNLTVPMDQFNPSSNLDKTFMIPLIRLRGGKDATQNVLLNPGGPGGSGLTLLYHRGAELRDIVGDGFHLLSFDPRGVNASVPRGLCYPSTEARREMSTVRTAEAVHDSAEMYGWTKNFVRACKDTMGEHGAYLTTPQTAADMNSILDAVGQKDMYYWGFSYGTTLGQTYAQLFPERSKRIILDGVSNSFHWYGAEFDSVHYVDTENVFEGFFSQCIKEQQDCALFSLGDTAEQLHKLVFDLGEKLKAQPMSVYVNNTAYGLLTYENIFFNGIMPALYRPLKWYALADNLAKLLRGNATDAWLAYARTKAFDMGDDSSDFIFNNDARSGPEYWPQDRQKFLDTILPIVNMSVFGAGENIDYYTKQQWLLPQTTEFTPRANVQTAHPILLVSMTTDPICPLVSAKTTQEVFEGSGLVEINGFGHCSVSVTSVCAAQHVRAFLYNGTMPNGRYVKCEVDRPYFIAPEQQARIIHRRASEESEDERIRGAQLNLAQGWEWEFRRGGLPMPM